MPAFEFSCALEMLDLQHDDAGEAARAFAQKRTYGSYAFPSAKLSGAKL